MYYQFNKEEPAIIEALAQKKPQALSTYMLLVQLSNKNGACVVPQKAIAKQIDRKVRTVKRYLNYLASMQYIGIARSGRANVYILNYDLIWHNKGYRKAFIRNHITFTSTVTLTRAQNPKFFKDLDKFLKRYGHKSIDLKNVKQKHVKLEASPHHHKSRKDKKHSVQNKSHRKPVKQHQTNKSHASRNASDLMANAKKARQLSMFNSYRDYSAKKSNLFEDKNKKPAKDLN